MKNKVITYILLVVVIGIWGRIIYSSFFRSAGEEESSVSYYEPVQLDEENKTTEKIELIANYRDPFLGKGTKRVKTSINKPLRSESQSRKKENPSLDKPINWPSINYYGLMKNVNSSDKIAIINIEKKQVLWREGEQYEDLSVLKIYKDSILLSLADENKIILKN